MKYAKLVLLMVACYVSVNANAQLWKQYEDSALAAIKQNEKHKAIEYYDNALKELKIDSSVSDTYADYCLTIAGLYISLGKYLEPESYIQSSKTIYEAIYGRSSQQYAWSCNYLGAIFFYRGQYPNAEFYWNEVKQIRERLYGKESSEYAKICSNLAILNQKTGQYEQAADLYQEVRIVTQIKSGIESSDFALVCYNIGSLNSELGRYDTARKYFEEAKRIQAKVLEEDHISYLITCSGLVALNIKMSNYDAAENQCLEIKHKLEESLRTNIPTYAYCCTMLAVIYVETGRLRLAEQIYFTVKDYWENVSATETSDYAEICNNLGVLFMSLGEFEKSEKFHIMAMVLREKIFGNGSSEYALSINNLANLYKSMGQYKKAESFYKDALLVRKLKFGIENSDYARTCNDLGTLYEETSDLKKAESLHLEAKNIRENLFGKLHRDYAESCSNLAIVYISTGEFQKAESLLRESINVRQRTLGIDHPDYGNSCQNLGTVYSMMQLYDSANKFYKEGMDILASSFGKLHPKYANILCFAAINFWKQDDYEKANKCFLESLEIFDRLVKDIFQFTSENEKQAYISTNNKIRNLYFSFVLDSKQNSSLWPVYFLSVSNRDLILNSSQKIHFFYNNIDDSTLLIQYFEWRSIKEQIAYWYSKPLTERNGRHLVLENKADQIEKRLVQIHSNSSSLGQQNIQEIKGIYDNLNIEEAVVEFRAYNYYDMNRWVDTTYYIALVLRKNKPEPILIKLFEERELNDLLKIYKGTSGEKVQLNFLYSKNEGQKKNLYDLIWKPFEKELKGIKTVYFAPSGSLFKISFAALPINNKEVLSDKYKLVQLNTTASVVEQAHTNISVSDNIILYGGVKYDMDSTAMKLGALQSSGNDVASRSLPDDLSRDGVSEFDYLEGTSKEANGIKKLAAQNKYNITVKDGEEANEESFKLMNGKSSPSIVHIATHGFFFPDPGNIKKNNSIGGYEVFRQSDNPLMRSGLALAGANNAWKGHPVKGVEDGILTSYEVSNMYLPNTKLAVLSACETGLGDIQGSEGVYGLQRAFKIAGVQNLIMSLWKVPDLEASEFMEQFYKNLFSNQSIQDAFYATQTLMRSKYRSDPSKWAAWVLIR